MDQSIIQKLNAFLRIRDRSSLISKTVLLQKSLLRRVKDQDSLHVLNGLEQVLDSRTTARAHYYINRLIKGLTQVKNGKLNDINLNRWKEYDDILTDSLWILDKRDRSGRHSAEYWGNFAPQIPNQLIRRFTKKGEWVLDPFLGSGTTLIECKRQGRNGIGIELQSGMVLRASRAIKSERSSNNGRYEIINGDSTKIFIGDHLRRLKIKSVQLVVVHPPYWDIIKFSRKSADLSNASTLNDFINKFGTVIQQSASVLDRDRYLAVVIGDKYRKQEWIPLGFLCMQEVLKHGFSLKSIIIKNFKQTKAKRGQEELWRYRALIGGFYVFKHEYIFLFRKI